MYIYTFDHVYMYVDIFVCVFYLSLYFWSTLSCGGF